MQGPSPHGLQHLLPASPSNEVLPSTMQLPTAKLGLVVPFVVPPLAGREGSRGRSQARLARGVAAGRRAGCCSCQGGRCSEESEMRKKDAILEAAACSSVANS